MLDRVSSYSPCQHVNESQTRNVNDYVSLQASGIETNIPIKDTFEAFDIH